MTEHDKDRFRDLMRAVATEKRFQDQLDNVLLRLMFDQLAAVDIEDLYAVRKKVCLSTRYWPQAGEWLAAVDELPPPTVLGLLPPRADAHGQVRYCEACDDTGMIVTDRLDGTVAARNCECRATNPALGAGQRRKLGNERSER